MNFKIDISLLINVSLYFLIICFSFFFVISPEVKSEYPAYSVAINYNIFDFLISYIFVVSPLFFLKMKDLNIYMVVVFILYILLFIPSWIFIFLTSNAIYFHKIFSSLAILLSLFLLYHFYFIRFKFPKFKPYKNRLNISFFFSITILLLSYFFVKLGRPRFVNIYHVYDKREEFKKSLSIIDSTLLNYGFTWLSFVLNPLMTSIGLNSSKRLRSILFITIGVIGQLLLYSYSGMKSTLFSIVMILCIYFLIKRFSASFYSTFLRSIIILFSFSDILYFLKIQYFSVHFLRRLFIVPGMNFGFFIQYFSEHNKFFLSNSIFRSFVNSNYSVSPPFIIGEYFYQSIKMSANGNFLADSFAQFGYFGILFYTLLLSFILKIMLNSTKNLSLNILLPSVFLLIYALSNSALLTVILTYGLFLYLIIMYCLNKNYK